MQPPTPLLALSDLSVDINSARLVRGLEFALKSGQSVGVVGESGSGKTLTALAIMGLLPRNAICHGSLRWAGRELLGLSDLQRGSLRGAEMAMIFQEPMSALNPVIRVGEQIAEMYRLHKRYGKRQAAVAALAALDLVRIGNPADCARRFAHQLSGGQRQRVMIAIALACTPKLLIADEPTTALDVTVQAQILELIADLRERSGTAVIFVSHNLAVVSEVAERLLVMYAGRIVEQGPMSEVLAHPAHPYTQGLLATLPQFGQRRYRLPAIPGSPGQPLESTELCPFVERCDRAIQPCREHSPPLTGRMESHSVRCWQVGQMG